MTTFFTTFKNVGSVAEESALAKHANSWSVSVSENAIPEESSMCDLIITFPKDVFNGFAREYTMTMVDSQKYSFTANDFWTKIRAAIGAHYPGVAYTLKVKRGLALKSLDWNDDVSVSSSYNPIALLMEHISAPALGFPDDDEAANVDYDKVVADVALGESSKTVGSFARACGKSDVEVINPVNTIDGSVNFMGALLAYCDATRDSPNGLDGHLFKKGDALSDDVHANPQSNIGSEFVFHAESGDKLVINFVLTQTPAASAIDGLGRLIVSIA